MTVTVDTSQVDRAAKQCQAAPALLQREKVKLATRIAQQMATYIKREFRSGPTSDSTTQRRSNRLNASYAGEASVEGETVVAKAGLIQGSVDGSVLQYGRLVEGYNPDGSTFTSKTIRAKNGGLMRFPIYRSHVAGTAASNIIGWRSAREVTFRPRPSFPATEKKFQPQLESELSDMGARVLAEVGA